MRAKYLYEWFPPIIEEDLEEVKIEEFLSEVDSELLRNELGRTILGNEYQISGIGNPELPSNLAGKLGGEVRRWKLNVMQKVIKGPKL